MELDSEMAALAARQHGNITRRQLLALGLTANQVTHRARSGRLIRRFTGVYAVGHVPAHPRSRAAAAVLACGSPAALGHESARALWDLPPGWPARPEVITPRQRRISGICAHRDQLAPIDITIHWGIRVTTPARTLLDIAPHHTREELARFANDLKARGFLHDSDIPELLHRLPGRPGAAKLNAHTQGYTRSGLERRFQRFCAQRGLPLPLMNAIVLGREVDAWFPEHKLIVELDTPDYHADPASFERDRDNDATALAHGIRTLRITGQRLAHQPDREERRLRSMMSD